MLKMYFDAFSLIMVFSFYQFEIRSHAEINRIESDRPSTHSLYVMRFAIWYHLYNLKNVKNTHGRVLILVKLQAEACNFTKINIPLWLFFTFFKLYKWFQITQGITYLKV